jgi:hypothetical protein
MSRTKLIALVGLVALVTIALRRRGGDDGDEDV